MMAGIVEEFGQTKLTLLPVQPGTKRTAHHCGMGSFPPDSSPVRSIEKRPLNTLPSPMLILAWQERLNHKMTRRDWAAQKLQVGVSTSS